MYRHARQRGSRREQVLLNPDLFGLDQGCSRRLARGLLHVQDLDQHGWRDVAETLTSARGGSGAGLEPRDGIAELFAGDLGYLADAAESASDNNTTFSSTSTAVSCADSVLSRAM